MQYYINLNSQVMGPMSAAQVMQTNPTSSTLVSTDGCNWQPLYVFPELNAMLGASNQSGQVYGNPNQPYQQPNMQQPYGQQLYKHPWDQQPYNPYPGQMSRDEVSSKKTLCGIMAILFGVLGIQYFVVGKVGAGLLTILISICTCGAWEVITLIQGIVILCNSDADFERKYLNPNTFFPLF